LAYLLPLIDDIMKRKQESTDGYLGYDYARAVILVPNKELAAQVVRMASELCGGRDRCVLWEGGSAPQTPFGAPVKDDDADESSQIDEKEIVRLAVMPGGLKDPKDFRPFRTALTDPLNNPPVDLVITTPASLGPMALSPKNIDLFADILTVVIDEADMLLDGGYLRQLNNVLMGFRRADKLDSELTGVEKTQHVLVAATLPDVGLKSVDAYIAKKFPYAERVTMDGLHNARHYGLRDSTIWIEDAEDGSNKARMEKLVQMLQTPSDGGDEGGLGGEKVMVFLNSVDDVDGATGALCRAGLDAVPYHAKMSLSERADNLDRFRRYEATKINRDEGGDTAPVLVCTDLASRGLDVPGVTAVVQLQFAGNVVAHLHRMGRCGRAGKKNGHGVVFYGEMERELVEVVRKAEHQQETMTLEQDVLDEELDENGNKKPRRGSVQGAFSRKRGFTKKRKKERRVAGETSGGSN
jgi:superfamily II DNA/RNA helicase